MIEFRNKIVFVGYGAVARCTLPLLVKHIKVPPKKITIIEFEDRAEELRPWTRKGVHYVRDRVAKENLGSFLGK